MHRRDETDPGWRAASWVAAACTALAAVAMTASLLRRARVPVEAVSGTTLAVALTASVFTIAGAAVLATTRDRDLTLISAATSMLSLTAVALSILGILVLPFVALALVLLVRRASGRRGIAGALLAGPVIAAGLATMLVVWVQAPLVECTENGISTTSRPWWDSSSGTGRSGGSRLAGEESTGHIETPSGSFAYRCDGTKLVQFRRV